MGMLITCFRSRRLYNSFLILVIAQILILFTYVPFSQVPLNYSSGAYEEISKSPAYDPLFFSQFKSNSEKHDEIISSSSIKMKKILFWTKDNENSREYAVGLGRDAFRKAGCPVWQCENHDQIMLNSGNNSGLLVQDYDAVVFFESAWNYGTKPFKRSTHQHYVFWSLEAPGFHRNLEESNQSKGFFNRTMTHRLDSDIISPYGWFLPVNPSVVPMYPNRSQLKQLLSKTNVTDFIRLKSKMAVWIPSNCIATNGRNEIVERLSKFIEIDFFGECGNMTCNHFNDASCRKMFGETYKFFIAIEDSFCKDYITEIFYKQMHHTIVPVVFDLHGHYAKWAPPHSYVNAADFPSILQLANYLTKLDWNDDLYAQYFWWKKHFVVHDNMQIGYKVSMMCQLCSFLHGPNGNSKKVYNDLIDWLDAKAECKTIRFPKMLNETGLTVEDTIWTEYSALLK